MKDRKTRISEQQSNKKVVKESVPKQASKKREPKIMTVSITQPPKQTVKQKRKIVFRAIRSGDKMEVTSSYS